MIRLSKIYSTASPVEFIVSHCLAFAFSACILAGSFVFTPEEIESHKGLAVFMPRCLFKSITGHPCPTCGMTRAFSAISRCEFRRAYEFNRLSFLFYGTALLMVVASPPSLIFYLARRKREKSVA